MKKKALIIGFGSIGRKYYGILKKISEINEIRILTKQKKITNKINNFIQATKFDPDLIIVSSNTSKHLDHLRIIEKNFVNKFVLVEKPLFDKYYNFKVEKNKIFVGYNLRFDPVIQFLKTKLANKKLWSVNVICNSYLPEWRGNRDYTKTYSAKRQLGGGVLLDLSHELDYIQWLFGAIKIKFVINNKISNLKINTDDNLLLFGKTTNIKQLQMNLNYFSKISTRKIYIDGPKINIVADLLNKKIIYKENGNKLIKKWSVNNSHLNYVRQIKTILQKKKGINSKFYEALKLMKLINKIKSCS